MDRAIQSLASLAGQAVHFSKKRSSKQPEDKRSLINERIFARRCFPFLNLRIRTLALRLICTTATST